MELAASEPASDLLLADLRSDKGMKWLPESDMWLSYLKIDTPAGALDHDLAIDPTGLGTPSKVAAGLVLPKEVVEVAARTPLWAWALAAMLVALVVAFVNKTFGSTR
jgi:hypothetical protein